MKLFFILGNNPALSVAEISAVLPPDTIFELPDREVLTAETPKLDERALIKRLGGTIKIGEILSFLPSKNPEEIKEEVKKILKKIHADRSENNKFCFGFSYYGPAFLNTQNIGLSIKKDFKEEEISCRLVVGREKSLSSVIVEQNNLVSSGAEIIFIEQKDGFILGRTKTVQDFKGLEKRDFKRPDRDDQSGMLPPKLAQIMLNLSGKIIPSEDPIILDPFCGSGTVMQEAALMGIKKIIGSDISEKAVDDTENNMRWLAYNWQLSMKDWQLYTISADRISQKIENSSIDAIVTEPYLGPQRGWHNINETKAELEELYFASLKEFNKILKKGGKVVMIWPVFAPRPGHEADYLDIDISSWKKTKLLPENIKDKLKINRRDTIIYNRPGQKIWREIIVLEKQ